MYYDPYVDGEVYEGIPVDRLPIEAVDVPDAHRRRSARYSAVVDIEPEHGAADTGWASTGRVVTRRCSMVSPNSEKWNRHSLRADLTLLHRPG